MTTEDQLLEPYTFTPTARFDEEVKQYYPGCRVTQGERFVEWREIVLGFDLEKYAMPYARELVREVAGQYRQSLKRELDELRRRFL